MTDEEKLSALVDNMARARVSEVLCDLDVPGGVHEQVAVLALEGVTYDVTSKGRLRALRGGQRVDLVGALGNFVRANPHFGGGVAIDTRGAYDDIKRGLSIEATPKAAKQGGRIVLPAAKLEDLPMSHLISVGLSNPLE